MKESHIETLERRFESALAIIADLKKQRDQALGENEELKRTVDWYKSKYFAGWEQVGRWRTIAEKWHGKYAITKHENNKLRHRLWRKTRKEKHEPQVPSPRV